MLGQLIVSLAQLTLGQLASDKVKPVPALTHVLQLLLCSLMSPVNDLNAVNCDPISDIVNTQVNFQLLSSGLSQNETMFGHISTNVKDFNVQLNILSLYTMYFYVTFIGAINPLLMLISSQFSPLLECSQYCDWLDLFCNECESGSVCNTRFKTSFQSDLSGRSTHPTTILFSNLSNFKRTSEFLLNFEFCCLNLNCCLISEENDKFYILIQNTNQKSTQLSSLTPPASAIVRDNPVTAKVINKVHDIFVNFNDDVVLTAHLIAHLPATLLSICLLTLVCTTSPLTRYALINLSQLVLINDLINLSEPDQLLFPDPDNCDKPTEIPSDCTVVDSIRYNLLIIRASIVINVINLINLHIV